MKRFYVYVKMPQLKKFYPLGQTIDGHTEPVDRKIMAYQYSEEVAEKVLAEYKANHPEFEWELREVK